MNDFTVLEVGKEFPMFSKSKYKTIGIDGCIIEMLPEGHGYTLSLYMSNMTQEEIKILRFNKISCKYIQEGDFILTLISYNSSDILFELSLDPTLYKDDRSDFLLKTNMLTVVGIESTNNIVKTIRYCSIPIKLYNKWLTAWSRAKEIESYSEKYIRWVDDLDRRYSLKQLWDIGVYIGKIGE